MLLAPDRRFVVQLDDTYRRDRPLPARSAVEQRSKLVSRRLAVLGGVVGVVGSLATAHFYRLLVELCPARTDQQHLRLVLRAELTVPDRTAVILAQAP
jgi:hypothetical protein